MAKAKKRKVSPCSKCKGFNVPGRRVKTVSRAANGRFKPRGK